jgi:hypothetical protein
MSGSSEGRKVYSYKNKDCSKGEGSNFVLVVDRKTLGARGTQSCV